MKWLYRLLLQKENPKIKLEKNMKKEQVIIEGRGINKIFGSGKTKCHAVKDVDFTFHKGEIISIVGESGSGKTTLANMIMGLLKQSEGDIFYHNKPRDLKSFKARKEYWSKVQAVFQDPFSAFNRFYKVESLFKKCFKLKNVKLTKEEEYRRMKEACTYVNIDFDQVKGKLPFELSGGQMQRMMIGRVFLIHPQVLIADEPTSMVDACSRATILNILLKMARENNMTIIFVTHDVGLAYYVSDTVYIMQRGEIVERGTAESVIGSPTHSYTKQLLSDVPRLHESWDLD